MKKMIAIRMVILLVLITSLLPTTSCSAGGELYWYFVKYQPNINTALQELRLREFKAGRYNPVIPFVSGLFPIRPNSPAPGAKHASIHEALIAADADGTRSILDLDHISDTPQAFAAAPLNGAILLEMYRTKRPTHETIERNMNFFEYVERGSGIYIIVYKNNKPDEIFFAGVSCD